MKLFEYKPLHLPLIEALPEKLFPRAAPEQVVGQLALNLAEVIPMPMAEVVELPVRNNAT